MPCHLLSSTIQTGGSQGDQAQEKAEPDTPCLESGGLQLSKHQGTLLFPLMDVAFMKAKDTGS